MSHDTSNQSNIATYTFYPVVRPGLRPDSEYSENHEFPDAGESTIELTVRGSDGEEYEDRAAVASVFVYGPGEVTGVDDRQIVRREPEPDTDAYPPRQFPLIEFDRPDVPWLFSPQRANAAGRVHPWCCLAVVDRDHPDVSFDPVGPGSLPVLRAPASELPDPTQSWAWAHAQRVGADGGGADVPSVPVESPRTRSRLLCPRNLESHTRYRACLIPTFEPGRLAGLGRDPGTTVAFWDATSGIELPVYDTWTFVTSPEGDFASLARALEPVVFGPGIGTRPVDASAPGPTTLAIPGDDEASTVGLEGALISPVAEPDPYLKRTATTLASLLNRAEEIDDGSAETVVAPPLYGRFHARRSRLDVDELEARYPDEGAGDDPTDAADLPWFDLLNADPRYRTAAGFGTTVVQDDQEALVATAWEQFGDLRAANDFLNRTQLVREALEPRYDTFESLSPGRLLQFTEPIHPHVFLDADELTLAAHLERTTAPSAVMHPTFRRLTSQQGPLARRAGVTLGAESFADLLKTGSMPGGEFDAGSVIGDASGDGVRGGVSDGFGNWSATETRGWADADAFGSRIDGLDLSNGVSNRFADGVASPADGFAAAGSGTDGPDDSFETTFLSYTADAGFVVDFDAVAERETRDERGARRRVLALLESVERHCLAAERDVTALEAAVARDDARRVRTLLSSKPTVTERCGAVVPTTVGPLSRALSKLLLEPRPPTVAASLTADAAEAECDRLRAEQRRLDDAVASAIASLADPERDRRPVERRLSSASTSLSRMTASVEALRGMIATERRPAADRGSTAASGLDGDRAELNRFRDGSATTTTYAMTFRGRGEEDSDLGRLRTDVLAELDPNLVLPELAADRLGFPALLDRDDPLEPVMAAPTYETATYELLADLDPEYFLPGIGEIPTDSVGLLETNPAFVEAFLVGLNHELARELRWRKFPTDRRGSYFRRFWDRRIDPGTDSDDPDAMADIAEIHTWDDGPLGTNGVDGAGDESQIVLLVRGELFRRYPNTAVYARKATDVDGERVPALPETGITRSDEGDDLKFPVFRGTLESDVTFFGFDLSAEEAYADPYAIADADDHDDQGWFFVLEEPPADARFGMLGGDADDAIDPIAATGRYVDVDDGPPSWLAADLEDAMAQGVEESGLEWGRNGAHMADILWRTPVRVAIHASELLPEPDADDAGLTVVDTTDGFDFGTAFDFGPSPDLAVDPDDVLDADGATLDPDLESDRIRKGSRTEDLETDLGSFSFERGDDE